MSITIWISYFVINYLWTTTTWEQKPLLLGLNGIYLVWPLFWTFMFIAQECLSTTTTSRQQPLLLGHKYFLVGILYHYAVWGQPMHRKYHCISLAKAVWKQTRRPQKFPGWNISEFFENMKKKFTTLLLFSVFGLSGSHRLLLWQFSSVFFTFSTARWNWQAGMLMLMLMLPGARFARSLVIFFCKCRL